MDDQDVIGRSTARRRGAHAVPEGVARRGLGSGPRRLKDLGVSLDQCWDLLHQRRARRQGMDPDDANVRDERTVEGYVN
jgi:hypothetical protein